MSPANTINIVMVATLLLSLAGTAVEATRYAAASDIILNRETQLYVAYIIEDSDIMVKKACECIPRRKCLHRDNVQLTEDKCSNPNTCCVTTAVQVDFDRY